MKFLTTLRPTVCVCVCVCVQSLQSCPTLCDSMDVAHWAPLSMGFSHAMILVCVAIASLKRSSQSRDRTHVNCVSCIAGGFFPLSHGGRPKPQFAYL